MKTRKAKRTLALTRKSPPKVAARSAGDQATLSALRNLEEPIRDLERAANIAFLMTMHDRELDDDSEEERLALFAVSQVERLGTELREQFYRACDGNAVQS
jgi:hypothetical protein